MPYSTAMEAFNAIFNGTGGGNVTSFADDWLDLWATLKEGEITGFLNGQIQRVKPDLMGWDQENFGIDENGNKRIQFLGIRTNWRVLYISLWNNWLPGLIKSKYGTKWWEGLPKSGTGNYHCLSGVNMEKYCGVANIIDTRNYNFVE